GKTPFKYVGEGQLQGMNPQPPVSLIEPILFEQHESCAPQPAIRRAVHSSFCSFFVLMHICREFNRSFSPFLSLRRQSCHGSSNWEPHLASVGAPSQSERPAARKGE